MSVVLVLPFTEFPSRASLLRACAGLGLLQSVKKAYLAGFVPFFYSNVERGFPCIVPNLQIGPVICEKCNQVRCPRIGEPSGGDGMESRIAPSAHHIDICSRPNK
ncbi:uncharacterized protein N7496_000181 [Penicillium cataractarum]|uniref:Uncharacterized protein n=1 Tax=Penicillium cataractarum TaxID=2100454 RepID=A0A9W9VTL2_9EURO|nr:uncharacterized protein N7496_000181 [Penicillium cataractarum]KAJ5389113.1 hypothetical protein N7496_000181 [Penicillium cataractarum]